MDNITLKKENNEILIIKETPFIINNVKYTNTRGITTYYKQYRFTLPLYLYDFINDFERNTYFYLCNGKIYMTPVEPPIMYKQQRYKIKVQSSCDTTFPTKLADPTHYNGVAIILYMNKKDFITQKYGLVEVKLI